MGLALGPIDDGTKVGSRGFWRFMKTNGNDSVYPVREPTRVMENGMDDMSSCVLAGGISKREYFSLHAPHSLLDEELTTVGDMRKHFNNENYHCIENYSLKYRASRAVAYADALIAALNEGKRR